MRSFTGYKPESSRRPELKDTIGILSGMTLTTIKVPRTLRDRINHDAAGRGVPAATFIAALLDEYERAQRFAAVRKAYADQDADDDYAAEVVAWDATAADGLADA